METAAELDPLRASAGAGDPAAMTALGRLLLIGKDGPFEPQEGLAMIRRAADGGEPEALAQLAVLHAGGAWTPQDWTAGLDCLQRAAELGHQAARSQLELIAADPSLPASAPLEDGADRWRRLRERIDIEAWTRPPERRAVCENPRIRVVERFAAPEVCRWLIERSRGKLKPARMFDGTQANPLETRTCSDYIFDITEADLVLLLVRERASRLTKLPTATMEPPQIFHYAVGQEIKAHFDHVRAEGGYQGERIATFLLYLNDDYEGGDLTFPRAGFSWKGRTGDAIFFANVDLAGKADRMSLHAATPVTRGEKYMFSQWIQDRPVGSA